MTKEGSTVLIEDDRTTMTVEGLKRALADNLFYVQGKFPAIATLNDYYSALAYTVRDRLLKRWIATTENYLESKARVVCYMSAEFLMGPQLQKNLINLGIKDAIAKAVEESGLNLEELAQQEEEPGLGNGGLGRLAACYLDSMASMSIPAIGYGIRYEFGIFDQMIKDGWQVEVTDKWLRYGNPWEIARPEIAEQVKFGGYTRPYTDSNGRYGVEWVPERIINGVPYDTPIVGYLANNANTLRLWKAEAPESFDFQAFNSGNYLGSVHDKMISENISKVLYPNDDQTKGKQLRLEQQFFFVSCSLQDLIRLHKQKHEDLTTFHKQITIQLNDTHPSIAVAELMRLLIDEHHLDWDTAWSISTKTFAYTNHTLLPEALERWPLSLFKDILPRHLEIIFEINSRFLKLVAEKFPGDEERLRRMSLIDEDGERYVRMANLACVGSYAINGVAQLHTQLLQELVLQDFAALWPEKFFNVTNGVTPRRWLAVSNPELSALITSKIGDGWLKNLDELKKLEAFVTDKQFCNQWIKIKESNKRQLARIIEKTTGVKVDPQSMFDIQVKRIHEYKRQHLNVLHAITLYNRIKENPNVDITPRTIVFAGKAAPGYFIAKLIVKFINAVADVINNYKDVRGRIKVVFLPDFNVKLAQHIYPAAELSEQISTAGKEASGTGNMKFALNGALTIGTDDGANVEIREEVGDDNFFLFGLSAQEVMSMKRQGYNPRSYLLDDELRKVVERIQDGTFAGGDRELFRPIADSLLNRDDYMLFADYRSYIDCQDRVSKMYRNQEQWTKMSILNTARTGKFSSDRSIQDYVDQIWKVKPVKISL